MSYDPYRRGAFPVGVRSVELRDESRGDRSLPVEIWYPAVDAERGRDLDPATQDHYELLPGFPAQPQPAVRDAEAREGRSPLIAFSHGYSGDRRQTTHFTTHLASHGYVVASADHTGNTTLDVMQDLASMGDGATVESALEGAVRSAELRPDDVRFVLDRVLADAGGLAAHVDTEAPFGMTGHSFGGWTTLMVTGRDDRIGAALPLAPAGGSVRFEGPNRLADFLDFAWRRDVPTLYLVADRDTLLPLAGMHELLAKTPGTRRMVVLENADHMHFCDNVDVIHEFFRNMPPPALFRDVIAQVPPYSELCPAEHAYTFLRGLGLAHFDAHLKGDPDAVAFLAGDVRAALSEQGVSVEVV